MSCERGDPHFVGFAMLVVTVVLLIPALKLTENELSEQ